MSATHTPGPWFVVANECAPDVEGSRLIVGGAGGVGAKIVAETNGYREGEPSVWCGGDPIANANLIGAAPEMLSLLSQAVGGIVYLAESDGHHIEGWTEWNRKARAVIAKAKGGV